MSEQSLCGSNVPEEFRGAVFDRIVLGNGIVALADSGNIRW